MSRRRDLVPVEPWADPAPAYAALALLAAPVLAVLACACVAGLYLLPGRALALVALPVAALALHVLFPAARAGRSRR